MGVGDSVGDGTLVSAFVILELDKFKILSIGNPFLFKLTNDVDNRVLIVK